MERSRTGHQTTLGVPITTRPGCAAATDQAVVTAASDWSATSTIRAPRSPPSASASSIVSMTVGATTSTERPSRTGGVTMRRTSSGQAVPARRSCGR